MPLGVGMQTVGKEFGAVYIITAEIHRGDVEGLAEAEELLKNWKAMEGKVPEKAFRHSLDRFEKQVKNARNWCDRMNTYFYRFTLIPDEKGRKIYD